MQTPRSLSYNIPGEPIPLSRPRFSGHHVYDSQIHAKNAAGIYLVHQHGNKPKFCGAISLDVTFYMLLPRKSRKRKPADPHIFKPDLSNMIKFIEDVAQDAGLLHDDCLIAHITANKIYDFEPKTIFTITELR